MTTKEMTLMWFKNNNNNINNNDRGNVVKSYQPLPPLQPISNQTQLQQDPRTLGIDINDTIQETKATWRGLKLSDDETEYVPIPNAIRMINESGAELLLGLFKQNVSIANSKTNLTESRIYDLVINFGQNVLENVCSQYKEFEIPKQYFDFIIDGLVNNYYTFLLKSLDDKQRIFDSKSNIWQNPTPIGGFEQAKENMSI